MVGCYNCPINRGARIDGPNTWLKEKKYQTALHLIVNFDFIQEMGGVTTSQRQNKLWKIYDYDGFPVSTASNYCFIIHKLVISTILTYSCYLVWRETQLLEMVCV